MYLVISQSGGATAVGSKWQVKANKIPDCRHMQRRWDESLLWPLFAEDGPGRLYRLTAHHMLYLYGKEQV